MDKDKLQRYYKQLESLVDAMTATGGFKTDKIYSSLAEICSILRLCKGVATVYRNPANEKAGNGEVFVCCDSGEKCYEAYRKRLVTTTMSIAECVVYLPETEAPLTTEESERADLAMRTLLQFLTRNRLETMNEKLTYTDENGYPNIRAFKRFLARRGEDGTITKYTALRYNLRHFSLINQEIGRRFGDIVIRKYYDMVVETVGDKGLVCRLGGDNYLLIVEKARLHAVLDILRGAPVIYDLNRTKRVMVAADTGVFDIPEDFCLERVDDVFDRVAAAMQVAKTGGKDSIVFFSDQMIAEKEKKTHIQQLYPLALENKEFKVFYQPKVDITTGEIVGAEALCRWFRDGEIVPPIEFIPILEQTTEICSLDFYMLNEVCGHIRRWLDEGRNVVRVSVNLSRKHMMDIDLMERIIGIIRINNVPPEYIEIELTETTTDVEFRDLKRVVSALQQAGVSTSVDDFGMGYSSLNLIREIPWNVLKVDRSFLPVDGDNSVSNRSIMFKYVVAMAREMGLECIAEGVETKHQIDVLRANNCGIAQGFFFDRPLPEAEFEKRLDAHRYNVEDGSPIE